MVKAVSDCCSGCRYAGLRACLHDKGYSPGAYSLAKEGVKFTRALIPDLRRGHSGTHQLSCRFSHDFTLAESVYTGYSPNSVLLEHLPDASEQSNHAKGTKYLIRSDREE